MSDARKKSSVYTEANPARIFNTSVEFVKQLLAIVLKLMPDPF